MENFLKIPQYSKKNTCVVVSFKAYNFIKKGLQHSCFPVNIMKFYRTFPVATSDKWKLYEWKVYELKVYDWRVYERKVYEWKV